MGKTYCVGTSHGGNCPSGHPRDIQTCWGCDRCPRQHGFRLGKGAYCPTCTKTMIAKGLVYSAYFDNYVNPTELPQLREDAYCQELAQQLNQEKLDVFHRPYSKVNQ